MINILFSGPVNDSNENSELVRASLQAFLAGSMRANVPPPPLGTVVRGVTVEPNQNIDVNYQQDVFDIVEQALSSHDMMEEVYVIFREKTNFPA